MVLKDKFGVPMEPEEPKAIAKDWWGEDLFAGDQVVVFGEDLVPYDKYDILEYVASNFERITLEEE